MRVQVGRVSDDPISVFVSPDIPCVESPIEEVFTSQLLEVRYLFSCGFQLNIFSDVTLLMFRLFQYGLLQRGVGYRTWNRVGRFASLLSCLNVLAPLK